MEEVSLPGIVIFIVLHEDGLLIEGFVSYGFEIAERGVHLPHLRDLNRHIDLVRAVGTAGKGQGGIAVHGLGRAGILIEDNGIPAGFPVGDCPVKQGADDCRTGFVRKGNADPMVSLHAHGKGQPGGTEFPQGALFAFKIDPFNQLAGFAVPLPHA